MNHYFLKSSHHYCLSSLRLVALDEYARESLGERNTGEPPASLGFLDVYSRGE